MTTLPVHPTAMNPLTGQPLVAIGVTTRGTPIWPVMGGSQPAGEPAQPAPPPAPAPVAQQPVPQFVAPAPQAPVPAPPAQPAPQPAPMTGQAPQFTQPPGAPTWPAAGGNQPGPQQVPQQAQPPAPGQPPATGDDRGYPVGLPVEQMTTDQQLAYWRHYARHHESRWKAVENYPALQEKAQKYDELVTATQTDQQRAVAQAAADARRQAFTEAGSQLVDGWFHAAAAGRLGQESVNAILAGLDRKAYLKPTGEVDTDKVYGLVNSIAPPPQPVAVMPMAAPAPGQPHPAPGQPALVPQMVMAAPAAAPYAYAPAAHVPDFGQGQPAVPRASGLEAGREEARRRFGTATKQNATPTQQ